MPNMYGGLRCYFGINSVTDYSHPTLTPDDCSMSPLYVNLYLFFNVIYNILIVVVLKYGSSNILWMSSTIMVPLSNLAFSMSFMPGHKPLTKYDVAGLVIIMAGLIVYRFAAQIISVAHGLCGDSDEAEETASLRTTRMAERKQTKYMGLNQIEGLSALFDSRVSREQNKLYRSPQQIRGSLLLKLGIPPSPHVSLEKSGRGNSFIEISKMTPRTNSFSETKVQLKPREPLSYQFSRIAVEEEGEEERYEP